MGGRGANSGMSEKGKRYGTEYQTALKTSNIKFVKRNDNSASAPLETTTKGRVYVTVAGDNLLNAVSYYDTTNKRLRTIELSHSHNGKKPHTHHGYIHNENSSPSGPSV